MRVRTPELPQSTLLVMTLKTITGGLGSEHVIDKERLEGANRVLRRSLATDE